MKKITLVLAALAAGIMMMVAAAPASAQPAPPDIPGTPDGDAPTTPDVKTDAASRVTGTIAHWTRSNRTLTVSVTCARSGSVVLSRNGNRIGRRSFTCAPLRTNTVRVHITRHANRRLDAGERVTTRVNYGSKHHTKRLRVVRATANDARVTSPTVAAKNALGCSVGQYGNWYLTSKVASYWNTNSSWWDAWCAFDGLEAWGSHTGWVWDYYFYNFNTASHEYYGSWFRPAGNPECWYFWHPASGRYYQAGAAGCLPLS